MTQPTYLLFDLDGTLVDSVADLTSALNLLGAELDQPPLTTAQVRGIVGDGAVKLIKRAFGEENYQRPQLLRFLELYRAHLTATTRCYPGIEALLASHPAEHLAVVTNKPYELSVELLAGLGLEKHFKVVIGGDSYAEKKPDPLPVRKALERLGADPRLAVMIGDHHTDLHSGQAAGIATCFCAYGLGNSGGLTADYQAETAADLQRLFPGPLA